MHYDSLDIAGYCSTHCRVTNALTVRMNVHVENAVARFEPGILKGVKPSHELKTQSRKGALARLCEGLYLPADRAAKLTGDQVFVQQVTGALKYPERVKPRLTWFLWRLARVMIYPWPIADAAMAARLLLELAYDYIDEGLTWGGAGVEDNPRVLVHMHGELDLVRQAAARPDRSSRGHDMELRPRLLRGRHHAVRRPPRPRRLEARDAR